MNWSGSGGGRSRARDGGRRRHLLAAGRHGGCGHQRVEVRVACHPDVQLLEPLRRAAQQRRRVHPALDREGDLAAQPLDLRGVERVEGVRIGVPQEVARGIRFARVDTRLGRDHRAVQPAVVVGRQLHGA